MIIKLKNAITLILMLFVCSVSVFATNEDSKLFYEININDEIGSTSWIYLKNGLNEANNQSVDGIFLHLNTYGGLVNYADSMRTAIINNRIPVYVFIDNNAASAGALISIACDSIYMRPGANIGAATVVNDSGEKMPDKYQSYMRSIIRSTAESHGKDTIITGNDTLYKWKRDPRVAEAMVDERIIVPGLVDSTQILTFTAQEAVKHGYSEGIYESIDEIITQSFKVSNYTIDKYEPTQFDKIKGWLLNPIIHGFLIMIIIGGIYFEMQSPGIGFPSLAALIAAILYFSPLYIDGLADIWEGAIFVVGIVLVILEIFVIPGFGVAGILGIILIISGLLLSLVNNDMFNFEHVEGNLWTSALLTILISLIGSVALIVYLSSKIGTDGMFRKLALTKSQDLEDGYIGVDADIKSLIGKEGVAATVLRPSGKISIDDNIYDAVAENGYIDEGETIIVKKYATGQLYVRKK